MSRFPRLGSFDASGIATAFRIVDLNVRNFRGREQAIDKNFYLTAIHEVGVDHCMMDVEGA
jgi:hypothetical protein